MRAKSRIQRPGRPPDCLGDFMGEDERVFVVCSNSSSVNSKSGSGWRANNRVENALPANDGPPATANIGHLPVAIIGKRSYSVKVLITKVPQSQFCGEFLQGGVIVLTGCAGQQDCFWAQEST